MVVLACSVVLVFCCAVWAQTVDFWYDGARPGDLLSGDIHYSGPTQYTQHADYWDYCYRVEFSNFANKKYFTVSVPVPVTPVYDQEWGGDGVVLLEFR